MIENIKILMAQVDNKTKAVVAVADACGKSPQTVRAHWLCDSGFWSVPESEQETVNRVLQNVVKLENEAKQ